MFTYRHACRTLCTLPTAGTAVVLCQMQAAIAFPTRTMVVGDLMAVTLNETATQWLIRMYTENVVRLNSTFSFPAKDSSGKSIQPGCVVKLVRVFFYRRSLCRCCVQAKRLAWSEAKQQNWHVCATLETRKTKGKRSAYKIRPHNQMDPQSP